MFRQLRSWVVMQETARLVVVIALALVYDLARLDWAGNIDTKARIQGVVFIVIHLPC